MATKIITDMGLEKGVGVGVGVVSKAPKVLLLNAIEEALCQSGHSNFVNLDAKSFTKDAKPAKETDAAAKELVDKKPQIEFK